MSKEKVWRPITKKAIQEMRSILEKFKTGKVPQNQGDYFCGTARCMAGEKFVEDMAQFYKDTAILKANFIYSNPEYIERAINDPWPLFRERERKDKHFNIENYGQHSTAIFWDYAQSAWGLSNEESHILFAAGATLSWQLEVVDKLADGMRFVSNGGATLPAKNEWIKAEPRRKPKAK